MRPGYFGLTGLLGIGFPFSAPNVPENAFLYGASGETLAFSRSGDDTVKLFDVSVK